jgi:hypothetical protein
MGKHQYSHLKEEPRQELMQQNKIQLNTNGQEE